MRVSSLRYMAGGGAELTDIVRWVSPGTGQVQVEVAACGICAWDIQAFKTGSDAPFAAPPGPEGVGYVAKLGPGVEGFAVGQRVACLRKVP
jgi:D-arabinose 1-dehydrogenase-like Zn-dependent alcohol dehydrogenase